MFEINITGQILAKLLSPEKIRGHLVTIRNYVKLDYFTISVILLLK